MTDTEKLAIAINALRQVRAGSVLTGRWIANGVEVGSDRNAPKDGYYDEDNPPDGYDASGPMDLFEGDHLEPACWEAYSPDEQTLWVSTCAIITEMALSQIEEKEQVNG